MKLLREITHSHGRWKFLIGASAVIAAVLLLASGVVLSQSRSTPVVDSSEGVAATPTDTDSPAVESSPDPVQFVRPTGRPTRAMVVGTSLSAGYYTERLEYTFASRVFQGLRKGGDVEQVVAPRLEGGLTLVASYPDMPSNLDLAVVELGTNDTEKVSVDTFRQQYLSLMTQLRSRSPNAAVYCLGPWRQGVVPYVIAIQDACKDVGGTYVQLGDLYGIKDLHGPSGSIALQGIRDEFHPNDSGHFLISQRVLQTIEPPVIVDSPVAQSPGSGATRATGTSTASDSPG